MLLQLIQLTGGNQQPGQPWREGTAPVRFEVEVMAGGAPKIVQPRFSIQARTAEKLEISLATLYRKLREYGMMDR